MWQFFFEYLGLLRRSVPSYVYMGILTSLFVGFLFVCLTKGVRKGVHQLGFLLLAEYVFLLLCSTVFFRNDRPDRIIHFQPLWSYKAYTEGLAIMFPENIMNVVVFIPIGIIFSFTFQPLKWWSVLMAGMGISVFIEIMQYILQKGTCDTDDVIHNTVGFLLGYYLFLFVSHKWETRMNRQC